MEGVAGRKVGLNFGEFSYVLATVYRSKLGMGQLGSRPFYIKTTGSQGVHKLLGANINLSRYVLN